METTYNHETSLKAETAGMIKEFIETENSIAYEGTLPEHVYNFFGATFFPDNTYNYGLLSVALLRALAKPKIGVAIKKEVGPHNYDDLVQMIDRLISFSTAMNTDIFNAVADLYQLEHHENTEHSLLDTNRQYAVKLAAVRAAKAAKEQIENSKEARACLQN